MPMSSLHIHRYGACDDRHWHAHTILSQALPEASTLEEMDAFRSNAMATNSIAGLCGLPQVRFYGVRARAR